MTKIHYKEQNLQIRCVRWFRISHPAFACLIYHPKNEEAGGRVRAAIAKAEGVQAGVADLILQVPSQDHHALAIEMKTKTGRQSPAQKIFQRYFEAAGGKYVIIRSFEDFQIVVTEYFDGVESITRRAVENVDNDIRDERTAEARRQLQRMLNKNNL